MIYFHKGEAIADGAGNVLARAAYDLDFKGRLNASMFSECALDLANMDERLPLTAAIVARWSETARV